MEHLYDRIKKARERAGLSVNDAADKLGLSRVQVWRMENKAETISAERLLTLASIYGVDPVVLYRGVDGTAQSTAALYGLIGEVVTMVEAEVQHLDARPSPHVVGEAVVAILEQEASGRNCHPADFHDLKKYRGLIALLIKEATKP